MKNTSILRELYESNQPLYANFKYKVKVSNKSVQLFEVFLGNEILIGRVYGWKSTLFKQVISWYTNINEREKGYRFYLAIKLLNTMNKKSSVYHYLKIMKEITLEEVIFWVWQYSIYNKKSLKGFMRIHMWRG